MSRAKVIDFAGARAARDQREMLRQIAKGVARPVEPEPLVRVMTMTPEQIEEWLGDEQLEPVGFWRASGGARRPMAIGDVADAIAVIRKGTL